MAVGPYTRIVIRVGNHTEVVTRRGMLDVHKASATFGQLSGGTVLAVQHMLPPRKPGERPQSLAIHRMAS